MIWCSALFEGQNQSDIHCSEAVWDPLTFSLSMEAYFLLQAICSIWEWLQKKTLFKTSLYFFPSPPLHVLVHSYPTQPGVLNVLLNLWFQWAQDKREGLWTDYFIFYNNYYCIWKREKFLDVDGHDMSTFLILEITVLA